MTDFHAGEKHFFVYILCVASETMIDTMMCHNPMEKKRQEHIKELIMTEKAYIEDMRLVHEVYLLLFFLSRFYFSNLFHFLPFFNLLNLYNQAIIQHVVLFFFPPTKIFSTSLEYCVC